MPITFARQCLMATLLPVLAACVAPATGGPTVTTAGALVDTPPIVPVALRAPADQTLLLKALATGVQIYTCAANAQDNAFAWRFDAPEATLLDGSGKTIGKHYAGPTWEANDGSKVVGQIEARDPGTDPGAIAWLRLSANAHSGSGLMTRVKSILRLHTAAGAPPSANCARVNANQVVRVPYTASYYFYGS